MKFFVLIMLSVLVVGCASHKEASDEVKKEAKAVQPTVDPRTQYARAISMIRDNAELKAEQKDKLVQVVNNYATKALEIRMMQSQYRAVLVSEMLSSGSNKNPKVDAAKRSLQKLNQESSKQLGKFIRDFKYYSGNTANNYQPAMIEVIRIQ